MLGLYKKEKWVGFTLLELENSCVQEDPKMYAKYSLLQGMWPEFSSDIAGDGPVYSDRELSDNSSSAEDSDSESTQGSESSYDPIKENKLDQKKRNAMLRAIRRGEQGREARRKDVESQKKKREGMGLAARRSEIKKRSIKGPATRKSEIEKRRKKGPEARKSEIEKRRKKGPEARRKDLQSQKRKRSSSWQERNW